MKCRGMIWIWDDSSATYAALDDATKHSFEWRYFFKNINRFVCGKTIMWNSNSKIFDIKNVRNSKELNSKAQFPSKTNARTHTKIQYAIVLCTIKYKVIAWTEFHVFSIFKIAHKWKHFSTHKNYIVQLIK